MRTLGQNAVLLVLATLLSMFAPSGLQAASVSQIFGTPTQLKHSGAAAAADIVRVQRGRRGASKRRGTRRAGKRRPPGAHLPAQRRNVRKNIRRRYWGRRVAGVILGTAIIVAAAGVVPPPPSPELCWYWSDAAQTQGYWYYCVEPDY